MVNTCLHEQGSSLQLSDIENVSPKDFAFPGQAEQELLTLAQHIGELKKFLPTLLTPVDLTAKTRNTLLRRTSSFIFGFWRSGCTQKIVPLTSPLV